MDRIEEAVRQASDEIDLGFDAGIRIRDDYISVDTRCSRDRSRRNNGGEYDFWLELWPVRNHVLSQTHCSCDFWQPQEEPERESLGWDDVIKEILSQAIKHNVPIDAKWSLVNPARCLECGDFARWHLYDGHTDYYACDGHLYIPYLEPDCLYGG